MSPTDRNRLKLLGIAALAALPVIASYLLYWFWMPQQRTNYGTLLPARVLPEERLTQVNGGHFDLRDLHGRWVLLTIDSGECDAACQRKLWIVRQVRLAQGKNMNRLERVWLIDDDVAPPDVIGREYAGTWMVAARDSGLLTALPANGSIRDHVYVVDPAGNLMLRFPAEPEPSRMIKDLSRLLRYSGGG